MLFRSASLVNIDSVVDPLVKFYRRPILQMSQAMGPPQRSEGLADRRRYIWERQDAAGNTCTLTVRVDEFDSVIDIARTGPDATCKRFIEDRLGSGN